MTDLRPMLDVVVDGRSYSVEEILFSKRLAEELYRTGLHGLHAHRHVSVGGDEHHRNVDSEPSKLTLKFQPTHSGQPHVEDQASRNIGTFAAQEFLVDPNVSTAISTERRSVPIPSRKPASSSMT